MSFGETLHRPALRTSERDRRCSQRANLQMSSILGIVLISVCALFIPNSSKRRLGYSPEPVVEGASRWSSERRTLPEHMLQRRGHKGFRPIFDSFTSAVGGGISGRPAYESTRDATRTGKAFAKAGGASGDAVSNKSTSRTTRGRPGINAYVTVYEREDFGKLFISGVERLKNRSNEKIRHHFSKYGNITNVELVSSFSNQKCRTNAFITYNGYTYDRKAIGRHTLSGVSLSANKAMIRTPIDPRRRGSNISWVIRRIRKETSFTNSQSPTKTRSRQGGRRPSGSRRRPTDRQSPLSPNSSRQASPNSPGKNQNGEPKDSRKTTRLSSWNNSTRFSQRWGNASTGRERSRFNSVRVTLPTAPTPPGSSYRLHRRRREELSNHLRYMTSGNVTIVAEGLSGEDIEISKNQSWRCPCRKQNYPHRQTCYGCGIEKPIIEKDLKAKVLILSPDNAMMEVVIAPPREGFPTGSIRIERAAYVLAQACRRILLDERQRSMRVHFFFDSLLLAEEIEKPVMAPGVHLRRLREYLDRLLQPPEFHFITPLTTVKDNKKATRSRSNNSFSDRVDRREREQVDKGKKGKLKLPHPKRNASSSSSTNRTKQYNLYHRIDDSQGMSGNGSLAKSTSSSEMVQDANAKGGCFSSFLRLFQCFKFVLN
eukprot:CAMPEP_0167741118 /NCGR_PEP_ID=MMETSP0110_2-20121227/676_1 /TAXON_ID=629695 /ORGANISM="Gymnochlora sp., Strain CCMP2014" /LENGTH=654 /DNA_ID=CAMNT_0007625129 /DNA_START=842 /DNA_END=2806 /DNA_ORIENTATION=-